jgi:hypothetical protein
MIITVGHKTINNSSFLKYILNNHFKNIKLRDISFTNHNKNKKLKKLKVRLLIQYIYIYIRLNVQYILGITKIISYVPK